MWKTLKQVLPSSKSVMEVGGLKVKNKLFTKLSDISEIFNKHFSRIGYKLGQIFGRVIDADQFPLKTTETFRLTPVTEKFVFDQLLQLKLNKAIGLDKISSSRAFFNYITAGGGGKSPPPPHGAPPPTQPFCPPPVKVPFL
jgi:hypothetical protein